MDSRISGLQEEMTKIQEHLRELQAENAQVRMRNQKLERENEVLRDEKGTGEKDQRVGTKGRTADSPHASSAGARGPDGAVSVCARPNGENKLGRFAQPPNHSSDKRAPKADGLPTDIRSRVENGKCLREHDGEGAS
jgi:hypothetical protein